MSEQKKSSPSSFVLAAFAFVLVALIIWLVQSLFDRVVHVGDAYYQVWGGSAARETPFGTNSGYPASVNLLVIDQISGRWAVGHKYTLYSDGTAPLSSGDFHVIELRDLRHFWTKIKDLN